MMENSKKLELLSNLFEVEAEELQPELKLINLENWDSMMKLALIVLIDDECGKKLTGEAIRGFNTVQDIMDFME